MESAQRELVSILLETIYTRGLLSKTTYLNAMDLVHSMIEIPPLFQYSARLTKEKNGHERRKDTQ